VRRRQFIALIGGAAAWPLAAAAQQPGKVWRIGFLGGGARPTNLEGTAYSAFLRGMRELGYMENKDFIVEWRFAEGRLELLPTLAEELVRSNVDVIVVGLTAGIPVVQRTTSTIPIVMAISVDPVGNGYVTSLARPTGNVTGLTSSQDEIISKQLQLIALLVPNLHRIGFLLNRDNPVHVTAFKSLQEAAQQNRLDVIPAEVRNARDLTGAFAALKQGRADVIVISGDAILFSNRHEIADLALKISLPIVSSQREYVEAGGLISYGESLADFYRRSTFYVDKLLKGAKPSELPIQQPTRFFTTLNRKTAAALRIDIPMQLLVLADEVIE
jgi:putative tryptophan/tyrosine transport system substrate-binding protein